MSTIKLLVLGVVLAGLVSAGAVLKQSTGVASSQTCVGCESEACSSCADHLACSAESCTGEDCSTCTTTTSKTERGFEFEGEAPACSACASESSDPSHAAGAAVPGEITVTGSASGLIKHADDATFEDYIHAGSGTVLVDFYADWCGPCKKQGAILEEIVPSLENATVVKVNVDHSPGLTKKFEITGIPALLVFRDGKLLETNIGVADSAEIAALIASE